MVGRWTTHRQEVSDRSPTSLRRKENSCETFERDSSKISLRWSELVFPVLQPFPLSSHRPRRSKSMDLCVTSTHSDQAVGLICSSRSVFAREFRALSQHITSSHSLSGVPRNFSIADRRTTSNWKETFSSKNPGEHSSTEGPEDQSSASLLSGIRFLLSKHRDEWAPERRRNNEKRLVHLFFNHEHRSDT